MHEKQREFLKRKFESGQLSHAYLFSGEKNIGKKLFAKEFAELIGCKFPDLMAVEPERREISIAKVREIQNFLAYKSYNGGFKMVIINAAHLMNQEAQNCLLKTLEEPKGKTILILVSSNAGLLLPTIYSRCQIVKFFGRPEISRGEKKQDEKILGEISAVAQKDLSEKFKYAKFLDFEKQSLEQILEVLQKHYRNGLLAGNADARRILKLIDEINFKASFTNINPKLALEILLLNL